MTAHARQPRSDGPDGPDEPPDVLRAKYLDYCSAQLADLLLYLTPDEIFVLSEEVTMSSPRTGYDRIVEVAMAWLAERVTLPPFEIWLDDYRRHPDRYEEYLMGFWREGTAAESPE
ncbi:MAG: hypothetical protein RQ745_03200 [Longimicrobiales bacterium]|nr:hypothetical protein [Longimicrobiales bacterium]